MDAWNRKVTVARRANQLAVVITVAVVSTLAALGYVGVTELRDVFRSL